MEKSEAGALVALGWDEACVGGMETRRLTSTGLKRTELKLSTPQVKERMGLLLCSSQMSTC